MGVVQMHSSCHLGPQWHEGPGPRGHSLVGAGAWGADRGGGTEGEQNRSRSWSRDLARRKQLLPVTSRNTASLLYFYSL